MTVITEATFVEGQFDDVEGELLVVHSETLFFTINDLVI